MNFALLLAEQSNIRDRIRFLDLPQAWIVFLLILPGIFLLSYLVYRWEGVSSRTQKLLMLLRAAILCAVVLILFRPVSERVQVMVQQRQVLVLMDDSASMQRKDSYPDSSTRTGIQEAVGLPQNQEPGDFSRAELMAKAVRREILDPLQGKFDLQLLRFSDGVSPAVKPEDAIGRGDRTRIGESLAQTIEQHRGQFVRGIVLFSDGQSNEGRDPRDPARSAGALGIPIYTVGIGDATKPHNISVSLIEAPQVGLEGDEITVTARVNSVGYSGKAVQLSIENEKSHDVLAEETAVLEEGEGKRISLSFTPRESGEYRLAVQVQPQPEETLTDDNSSSFTLQIRPEKIRVLYVESRPRYEYRYLKNTLLRADRNIQVQCFLLSANHDFPQEATKGSNSLTAVPTSSEELLRNYDVVILGDVDPYAVASNPEDCNKFMNSLKEFVSKGGGFLMIAGEYDAPRSYRETPIQDLLPVTLGDGEEDSLVPGNGLTEFHPLLENPTQPHEITRLHRNLEANRRLWEDTDGLRGLYWYYPIRKAKPGAEVLLRHPENTNRFGNHILAAVGYFPEGRTMFVGFDETWRWRYIYGETYAERFWRNSIRYLALNRLREGNRRFRISAEKSHYELNERAVIEARVFDENFTPSRDPNQKIFLLYPDGHQEETNLEAVQSQPGIYRASLLLGSPGSYRAWIAEGNDMQGKVLASTYFNASIPSREGAKLNLDAATLTEIAKLSGGRYVPLANIGEIQKLLQGDGPIEISILPPTVEDLWDNAWVLGALVVLLALEWIIRKRSLLI